MNGGEGQRVGMTLDLKRVFDSDAYCVTECRTSQGFKVFFSVSGAETLLQPIK